MEDDYDDRLIRCVRVARGEIERSLHLQLCKEHRKLLELALEGLIYRWQENLEEMAANDEDGDDEDDGLPPEVIEPPVPPTEGSA